MAEQVNVGIKHFTEICEPLEMEGGELRAQEGRRNGVSNYEVREVGEGLVVEDRGRVHPARVQEGLANSEVEMQILDTESGGLVGALVAVDARVPFHPGELEQGVVVAQEAKEILEQGTEGSWGSKFEEGEVGPAIAFHGQEAATNKAKYEGRVSVDV